LSSGLPGLLLPESEQWGILLTFAVAVDELRFELIVSNQAGLMLDNLVFAPVPEPATWALLALGVSALAWRHTRQVRSNGGRTLKGHWTE
jgi:hypothetical protein